MCSRYREHAWVQAIWVWRCSVPEALGRICRIRGFRDDVYDDVRTHSWTIPLYPGTAMKIALPSSPLPEPLSHLGRPWRYSPLDLYAHMDDPLDHSSYIWVWKSEAVVYSLILLVTLGPTWDEHAEHLPCSWRLWFEDGAPFEWPERRAGWPGSRIGGHQTRDGWLPTCSLCHRPQMHATQVACENTSGSRS